MNEIPEGRGSSPAGALVSGSPSLQHRDSNPGSAVPGRVVHCKREPYDVYIGRPGTFGNPYRIADENQREDVIRHYENHARLRLKSDEAWAEQVKALHGKTLGCWCAPKACHGDVLLKLAAELRSQYVHRSKE